MDEKEDLTGTNQHGLERKRSMKKARMAVQSALARALEQGVIIENNE